MPPVDTVYDIKEELGAGEFSVVFLGIHKATGEKYAIKVIDKQNVDSTRLETEVNILKTVAHKNIIQLKEFFDTPKKLYLIMELVTGGELFNTIVNLGSYTEEVAAKCVRNILSAVKYLHDHDIVHRDLKPNNLLLKSPDDITEVKVADFGLSKIIGGNTMNTTCGTPIYVAPEVLLGDGYDKAVDLWSVGVIMYILLAGFPPFFDDGTNMSKLFDQILSGSFEYPEQYWSHITEHAKDLINHLLQVDPTKRLTAAQALEHPWIKALGSSAVLKSGTVLQNKTKAT